MRVVSGILITCVCTGAALFVGSPAEARTPAPTPTSAPTPTATPSIPPVQFNVFPWVNADNTCREVTAYIESTLCATGIPVVSPGSHNTGYHGSHGLVFHLSVPSQQDKPGCGYEGAEVTFSIDGQRAPQTAVWHSGGIMPQHITAIIGPPFARLHGLLYTDLILGNERVVPYVGGQVCADAPPFQSPFQWIGASPYSWGVVVYSNEQVPGCGVEGSQITFKLLDSQGNVVAVANEKGTWHAWDGISDMQIVDLTLAPADGGATISMPNTGTGGASPGEARVWGRLSVLLAFAGLTSAALGFALRKRAMTR